MKFSVPLSKIVIVSAFILSACGKNHLEPVASFAVDKSDARVGEAISFINISQNATAYEWDFGDGSSSSEDSPTHSFSSHGRYKVSLTAKGEGGTSSGAMLVLVWDLVLKSSFDGDSVQFQGPDSFKAQPARLEFYNESSGYASTNLGLHDEGYSHQDMLRTFVNGISYGHHPSWTNEVGDGGVWKMIPGYTSRNWVGYLGPGLYTLVIVRKEPYCVWYVAGLTVSDE